jgi:hypothetical protein
VKCNGYGSFFVATFSFIKSTHILSFQFFLGTTTIGDDQVAFSIGCVNPTINNLSMSCLMVVT